MKDELPLRTIQPVVVPVHFYTCGTVFSGILAFFPAMIAGSLTSAIINHPAPVFVVGLVVYLLFFGLLMTLIGWKVYSGPGATTYRIFRDRIEVEEGLVNLTRRTVLLGGIIDVRLSEGVFQRRQGAGTVTLVIQPMISQAQGQFAQQTVMLNNIPDPGDVYDLLRAPALDRRRAGDGFAERGAAS